MNQNGLGNNGMTRTEIESLFFSLCRSGSFNNVIDSRVQSFVDNERFWERLFTHHIISNFVRAEVKKYVPDAVENCLKQKAPQIVTDETLRILPTFLLQNVQLNQILENHARVLSDKLTSVAEKTLQQIVNQDSYHNINRRYFEAFESRTDEALKKFEKVSEDVVSMTKAETDREISQLREEIKKREALEKEMENVKFGFGITVLLSGLTFGMCAVVFSSSRR